MRSDRLNSSVGVRHLEHLLSNRKIGLHDCFVLLEFQIAVERMWVKSICISVVLTQFLVIFQSSYAKPTPEGGFTNHNTTTESVQVGKEEDDVNITYSDTIPVLLTVLSPNDTDTAATEDDESIVTDGNTKVNATVDPEYYDDHNMTVPSLNTEPSGLLDVVDDLQDLDAFSSSSMQYLEGSTETTLFTRDEEEIATGSPDQTMTPILRESENMETSITVVSGENDANPVVRT